MTEEQKKQPSRLDLVRSGQNFDMPRTGRLVVAIDKVVEDPMNERKVFRNMEGLIASVQSVGVIEPITVTATDGGQYRIVTGHRRFRAARAAGLAQIEVMIRESDEEKTRRKKSLVSNIQREDIGPVELAEALAAILDEDESIVTQDDLAKAIGKDKQWVSTMLRILTLPTHLKDRVGRTQLTVSWDTVARIARLEALEIQEQLIDELLGGATPQEIRQRIQEHQGKKLTATSGAGKADPKPKQVYHTKQKATVIVQSEDIDLLSSERVIAALQEALKAAKKPKE